MQCFDPPKHLFLYLPAALRYHVVRVYHSQCNQENRSHGGQFNEGSFIREASQIVRRGKIAQIKHKVAATITRAGGTIEGADVTRAQGLNSLLGAGNLECKVGAGSAEESMAAASAESLQTLIKIPPETKRERERGRHTLASHLQSPACSSHWWSPKRTNLVGIWEMQFAEVIPQGPVIQSRAQESGGEGGSE